MEKQGGVKRFTEPFWRSSTILMPSRELSHQTIYSRVLSPGSISDSDFQLVFDKLRGEPLRHRYWRVEAARCVSDREL